MQFHRVVSNLRCLADGIRCSRPAKTSGACAEASFTIVTASFISLSNPAFRRFLFCMPYLLVSPANLQVHAEHIGLVTHRNDGNIARQIQLALNQLLLRAVHVGGKGKRQDSVPPAVRR